MKKLILIAVITLGALVSFGPLAQAADAPPEGQAQKGKGGANRLTTMTKELNLTPEQATKLKPILDTEAAAMQKIRQDTSLSREQRNEKVKALNDASAPKIKEILTKEQSEKWEKLAKDRQQRRAKQ